MRVFLTHDPEDRSAYFGRALPRLEAIADVVCNPTDHDLTLDELVEAAVGCEVIVAHRSTPAPVALFDRLPALIAFLRCAVDISTIDVEAASARGVLVAHADRSYIASTAELALGLMIDAARNITNSTLDYRAGRTPPQRMGTQLRGRTAGIIGYGSIGSYLADLLVALGMEVLVCDPFVEAVDARMERVPLPALLASSDVVFPLAPSTPSTKRLIGRSELAAMKHGAILVNVSRGELIDEDAVAEALDAGRLASVGLDVGSAPDQRPSPLLAERDRVVATPHLGGLTPANADAQAISAVDQVAAMLRGERPPRTVNADHAHRLREYWERSGIDHHEIDHHEIDHHETDHHEGER